MKIQKKIIAFVCIISSLIACKNSTLNVTISQGECREIINDIEMEMPGRLYVTNDFIVIENPRTTDKFLNVYNKTDIQYKGSFCSRGRADIEFIQPNISIFDSIATVYDLNGAKCVQYSLNSLNVVSGPIRDINPNVSNLWDCCNINDTTIVGIDLSRKNNIISVCNLKDTIQTIGNLPIDENYSNTNDINIGKIYFDKGNLTLLFLSTTLPYYEKYSYNNGEMNLITSKKYKNFDYTIESNNLNISDKSDLTTNITFSKKYIVHLRKTEEEMKSTLEKKGYDNRPKNFYLYDYDLKLVKIIKFDDPIIRFAVEPETDNIYMINYNDGYFKLSLVEI